MFFKLRNIEYEIVKTSVRLNKKDTGLHMDINIFARINDEKIDFELREIEIYIESFNTNVHNIEDLKNKKFVWNDIVNDKNESAGVLNIVEYEDVTKGIIEILKVDNDNITIHWNGTANVFWNAEYRDNVPFDIEFTGAISVK